MGINNFANVCSSTWKAHKSIVLWQSFNEWLSCFCKPSDTLLANLDCIEPNIAAYQRCKKLSEDKVQGVRDGQTNARAMCDKDKKRKHKYNYTEYKYKDNYTQKHKYKWMICVQVAGIPHGRPIGNKVYKASVRSKGNPAPLERRSAGWRGIC